MKIIPRGKAKDNIRSKFRMNLNQGPEMGRNNEAATTSLVNKLAIDSSINSNDAKDRLHELRSNLQDVQ